MGQVSIDINGRNYAIACDDGEEQHITELGGELASRVAALADAVGQVGDARLLVMAGLLLADELKAAKPNGDDDDAPEAAPEMSLDAIDGLSRQIENLAERAESVADRLDQT